MHVSVLVPNGDAVISSIVGSFKIFNAVNSFLQQTGQRTDNFYQIDLVGTESKNEYYGGLFQVQPTRSITEIEKTDLIIITTIMGDYDNGIALNQEFIKWIRGQRINHNAEVASLCTGAFLLAESGLLNGKSAATHWMAHEIFKQKYPKIQLLPEKIISEENGIYTSGGAYSFLNLLLHLVEKYNGRETAIWCSKLFEIEFDRENQNQFIIFQGQKDHTDEPIKKAQEIIESNIHAKISIEDLAEKVAISRRNFVRRFKKATANTPLEYIQRVKIEFAKKSLENSTKNVQEVMFDVGYNDDKAFRNLFRKITGLTPHEYRMKYNPEMAMLN